LLAETILCKEFGWKYGFLSGGIGVFDDKKMLELLKLTTTILKEKIWVNIGVLSKKQIKEFRPYIKGVVGAIEVLDPKLHKKLCPSKPIEPVVKMFQNSKALGLKNAMTITIGLGETIDDFKLLKEFIEKNSISKIHIYGLNIQKGTIFENSKPPTADYQAEWIKRTREAFPDIDIQGGIWTDKVNRVSKLLKAGATSISKFPILRKFGGPEAKEIERQAKLAGRKFIGTLTKTKKIDFSEIDKLNIDSKLKEQIKQKLKQYLKTIRKKK